MEQVIEQTRECEVAQSRIEAYPIYICVRKTGYGTKDDLLSQLMSLSDARKLVENLQQVIGRVQSDIDFKAEIIRDHNKEFMEDETHGC